MTADDLIPLALYGLLVVLTALGGLLGQPIALLVAFGLAILWVVMLAGHRASRDASRSD